MTERRGTVWYEQRRVAKLLAGPGGRILFEYDPEWIERGFAISLSLPLLQGTSPVDGHAFFAGLLPEGITRQRFCRQHRLSENDDLGLLLAIGRDCAGALAIAPNDAEPEDEISPVPITGDDFSRVVESHGQAVPVGAEGQRFSLAGAQDKLAVRIDGNKMWLPSRDRPSSHILKFETTRWVCFAEYLGHQLARRLGLPVASTDYREHLRTERTPYLRVERYDRHHDAEGNLRRLHQEDMAQAMGLDGWAKYEEHGGPSLGAVATLVRRHSSDPVADIGALRDWQLFNYLAGNSDAHAKNLALLYPVASSTPKLAPFYDLVCIEFLSRLGIRYDRKLAFYVGKNNVPEQITREDWTDFATAIGVPPKRLLDRLHHFAEVLPAAAAEERAGFAERFADNAVYDRFEESIRDRCGWTLRSVFGGG